MKERLTKSLRLLFVEVVSEDAVTLITGTSGLLPRLISMKSFSSLVILGCLKAFDQ